jgi:hypothetical protein
VCKCCLHPRRSSYVIMWSLLFVCLLLPTAVSAHTAQSDKSLVVCWHVQIRIRSPFCPCRRRLFYYYFAKSSVAAVVVSHTAAALERQLHQSLKQNLRKAVANDEVGGFVSCREKSYKHGSAAKTDDGGGAVEADSTSIITTTQQQNTNRLYNYYYYVRGKGRQLGQFISKRCLCSRLTRETINKPLGLALARPHHSLRSAPPTRHTHTHRRCRRRPCLPCVCL